MDLLHTIGLIAVVSVATLMTRALPFLIFGGKRQIPKTIQQLGNMLPPAVMVILVVYCFRNVDIAGGTHGLPELFASAAVVGLHVWKRNILLSILAGTALYMLLVQLVFV